MDNHINFVEDTYNTLKTPIDYIKTKIEGLNECKNSLHLKY